MTTGPPSLLPHLPATTLLLSLSKLPEEGRQPARTGPYPSVQDSSLAILQPNQMALGPPSQHLPLRKSWSSPSLWLFHSGSSSTWYDLHHLSELLRSVEATRTHVLYKIKEREKEKEIGKSKNGMMIC